MKKFKSIMGTTNDTPSVKVGYLKGIKEGEDYINTYIAPNPIEYKDNEYSNQEVVEDEKRINKNDPFLIEKRKRAFAKKHGGEVYDAITKVFEGKNLSPRKKVNKVSGAVEFNKGEEYVCRVTGIDDFGNATIVINGHKGIVYNASKIGLGKGMKRNVLFARKNKKGKCVFELSKNPEGIITDFYDASADEVAPQEILKKLFSQYGYQSVKEKLTTVIDKDLLEKTREEYKKVA